MAGKMAANAVTKLPLEASKEIAKRDGRGRFDSLVEERSSQSACPFGGVERGGATIIALRIGAAFVSRRRRVGAA